MIIEAMKQVLDALERIDIKDWAEHKEAARKALRQAIDVAEVLDTDIPAQQAINLLLQSGQEAWRLAEEYEDEVKRLKEKLAKYENPTHHNDHSMRHWDRTCPACVEQAEKPTGTYSDIVSDGGLDPRNKYNTKPKQEIEQAEKTINPQDLIIQTYSTDTGGWFKNDCGVKITHIPTGLSAQCDTERSQHRNRYEAMVELEQKIRLQQAEKQTALNGLAETSREIEQEPVAWQVHPFNYGIGHEGAYALTTRPEQVDAWKRKGWDVQPLYTTPPKREWQSLTDNEISEASFQESGEYAYKFARAIEAKLKDKNALL